MKGLILPILFLFVFTASLCKSQNLTFYGMTGAGGATTKGNIFKTTATGTTTNLYYFGKGTDGSLPCGSLIKASNGLLYGMTQGGGIFGGGIIFSYNILTDTEIDVHDFGGSTDGNTPQGSLIQVNDSMLYGMTYEGGIFGKGIVFSYNIVSDTEIKLHDFGEDTDGEEPLGSLLLANNGVLYGMTSGGGTTSFGTIFSYTISTDVEKGLYNFVDTDGYSPTGSLIQASDSLLYGMTFNGGDKNGGIIFSYNTSTNKEMKLYNFGGGTDGVEPNGSLLQVNDSLLYGLTSSGGVNIDFGTIFSYNILTGKETDLHDFGSDTDGQSSQGSLIRASNSLLYGMTKLGGANTNGIIFSYNISIGTETYLHNFIGTDGYAPEGDLLEDDSDRTGINKLPGINNQLSIYPNPTSGLFTIQLNNNQNGYTVEIYDVMGEKIYQSNLSNSQNSINLSSESAGMYFVYIKSNEGIEVEKVLLTK